MDHEAAAVVLQTLVAAVSVSAVRARAAITTAVVVPPAALISTLSWRVTARGGGRRATVVANIQPASRAPAEKVSGVMEGEVAHVVAAEVGAAPLADLLCRLCVVTSMC